MKKAYNFQDLTGQRFGRLIVIKYNGRRKDNSYWECKCDCGNICEKRASHIKSAVSKSCGCLAKENTGNRFRTHGLSTHPLKNIHNAMMSRCYNPNCDSYKNYGAKGIMVCERWHNFYNFYQDVHIGYQKGLEIDRFPNMKGNYEPSNYRWANDYQQARNKTDNRYLEYNGERMILEDWAKKINMDKRTIWERLNVGWSVEKALTTPILKIFSKKKQNII